jgi:hypothetical protein
VWQKALDLAVLKQMSLTEIIRALPAGEYELLVKANYGEQTISAKRTFVVEEEEKGVAVPAPILQPLSLIAAAGVIVVIVLLLVFFRRFGRMVALGKALSSKGGKALLSVGLVAGLAFLFAANILESGIFEAEAAGMAVAGSPRGTMPAVGAVVAVVLVAVLVRRKRDKKIRLTYS